LAKAGVLSFLQRHPVVCLLLLSPGIAAFGLMSEISLPLTLLPALAFVLFLRRLWKEYPAMPRPAFS